MTGEREAGTVTVCDNLKGYGFIRRQKGRDAFFFYTEVSGYDALVELYAGAKVSFVVEKTDKGPRAVDINLV